MTSARITDTDPALQRHRMVEEQLRGRGIKDERVLSAMEKVPRHLFVPPEQVPYAYEDGPLPIGSSQTISQPYMVARMTELLSLRQDSRVLEIGTGSGYQAAVLAELAERVWTVERIPELVARATPLLVEQGYSSVEVVTGDGSLGYPAAAPYDAILVTAAAPFVPPTLRDQLAMDGRMVIPVDAGGYSQELRLIERLPAQEANAASPEATYRETNVLNCVFVPLVGKEGYPR